MLGREPVVERQRPAIGSTTRLRDEVAMAVERPDDIAAAMQVKERGVGVGARCGGPFGAHPVCGDRLKFYVRRQPVGQAARIDVAAAVPVVVGAGPACQLCTQCYDFCISHRSLPRPRTSIQPSKRNRYGAVESMAVNLNGLLSSHGHIRNSD